MSYLLLCVMVIHAQLSLVMILHSFPFFGKVGNRDGYDCDDDMAMMMMRNLSVKAKGLVKSLEQPMANSQAAV